MYKYVSNGKLNAVTSLIKCLVKDQVTANYNCMFLGMNSVEVYQIIVRRNFCILFIILTESW